jgi:hypothetical protein
VYTDTAARGGVREGILAQDGRGWPWALPSAPGVVTGITLLITSPPRGLLRGNYACAPRPAAKVTGMGRRHVTTSRTCKVRGRIDDQVNRWSGHCFVLEAHLSASNFPGAAESGARVIEIIHRRSLPPQMGQQGVAFTNALRHSRCRCWVRARARAVAQSPLGSPPLCNGRQGQQGMVSYASRGPQQDAGFCRRIF